MNINIAAVQRDLMQFTQTLYAGTVRWNILLGASKSQEEVTQEEIDQACKDGKSYIANRHYSLTVPDLGSSEYI